MQITVKVPTPSEVGPRVRALRDALGLNQTEFGSMVGVSFTTVSRWETGQTRPSPLAWRRILELEGDRSHGRGSVETAGARDQRDEATRPAPSPASPVDFLGNPDRVGLLVEAERLSAGHFFNPAFATETALIDPLPHQRIAVYEHMLKQPRLRFLLADDAGAGKTIMTGLYIREMLSRRLVRRVLIVPPAGLVGNWERELRRFFRLRCRILQGRDAVLENPFVGPGSDLVLCSVDTLRGDRMFTRLQEECVEPYDLVVFDEAHKLSAYREPDGTFRPSKRYRIAEALAGVPDTAPRWSLPWAARHLLLLTATPHMGKDFPYYCLWRLLEPHVLSTEEAFRAYPGAEQERGFLRRTKEEMVYLDGRSIYPERVANTISYDLTGGEAGEQALYDQATAYMDSFYNKARILNPSAARFAKGVLQRRLASSTYALMRSLERRREKLDGIMARLRAGDLTEQELRYAQQHLEDLHDPFEETTADEEESVDGREEHEKGEEKLLELVASTSLAELEAERQEVSRLVGLAREVLDRGHESKFEKLREVLLDPKYSSEKLIVFTEHRDTMNWITRRLEAMGFTDRIAAIHGGLKYRQRDDQVDLFRRPLQEGGAQFLVATDAAGEGINLQFCWIMVNYDIPWNPARLEQRLGRIHRYGQKHDPVILVNLVAGSTREGRVLRTLLDKMERIRRQMRSDKVFDVIGRLFQNVPISRIMQNLLDEQDSSAGEEAIEGQLTEEQVRALEERERKIYGEGGDVRKALPHLRAELETEVYRKLLPGYVRQFIARATPALGLSVAGDLDGLFSLHPARPGALDPVRLALESYPHRLQGRLTVRRPGDPDDAIFLRPGEPVFDALRSAVLAECDEDAGRGAVFVDPTAEEPYVFHLAEVALLRRGEAGGVGAPEQVVESKLVAVRSFEDGRVEGCPMERLLLLRGAAGFPRAAGPFSVRALNHEQAALTYVQDGVGRPMLEARRGEILRRLPEDEDLLQRAYDYESAELALRRTRLADRVRERDRSAPTKLETIKERQRSLSRRREDHFARVRSEADRLVLGSVRLLARAVIVPTEDPEERKRHDAEVESIAMRFAEAYEMNDGARVLDVSRPPGARAAGLADHPGFDLLSRRRDGTRRAIEVKGRAGVAEVDVSSNEWAKACNLRGGYWLYVVYDCASPRPRMQVIQDPFGELIAKARGGVVISARDILDAGEAVGSGDSTTLDALPEDFRPLFWDREFDKLTWAKDRDFVVGRVLASGSWDQAGRVRRKLGDEAVGSYLRRTRGRQLSARQLRLWETVLDLPTDEVSGWIGTPGREVWERRAK